MMKIIAISVSVALIFAGLFIILNTSDSIRKRYEKEAKSKLDSIISVNKHLSDQIKQWEDHATRMKRIAGVPDSLEWSYKVKCTYPVNTQKIIKSFKH